MEPNFSLKEACRLLDKYLPLDEDDYTVPFLRALLEEAPARENIIKDICNTESSQEVSSPKNNGTDSLHLLYQWWRKYLILPCIVAQCVNALIFQSKDSFAGDSVIEHTVIVPGMKHVGKSFFAARYDYT